MIRKIKEPRRINLSVVSTDSKIKELSTIQSSLQKNEPILWEDLGDYWCHQKYSICSDSGTDVIVRGHGKGRCPRDTDNLCRIIPSL